MKYTLLETDRLNYISVVLLNEIINFQHYFPVKLEGEDVYLTDHLDKMLHAGLLNIDNGHFVPTPAGREVLVNFYGRYQEYLKMFDIFSAVDLEAGEFAFQHINNPEMTDEYWFELLADQRFSDVRIAVADFKGINPIEVVFMSYLTEGHFDMGLPRWQHYLTGSEPWNEILEICNTAIDVEYLKADGVLENVITQGSALAIQLVNEYEEMIRAAKAEAEANAPEETEEVTETTTTTEYVEVVEMEDYGVEYWEPYRDPYYVSPLWAVPIILWV